MKKKISLLFKNIFSWVKDKYLDFRKKRARRKEVINLKRNFKKFFNADPDEIRATINASCPPKSDENNSEYLISELQANARFINSIREKMNVSFFYDPEIINIHNEKESEFELSINDIVKRDHEEARSMLKNPKPMWKPRPIVLHKDVEEMIDKNNILADRANALLEEFKEESKDLTDNTKIR